MRSTRMCSMTSAMLFDVAPRQNSVVNQSARLRSRRRRATSASASRSAPRSQWSKCSGTQSRTFMGLAVDARSSNLSFAAPPRSERIASGRPAGAASSFAGASLRATSSSRRVSASKTTK
eukprot:Amastigsp_a679078_7.p4 type:complete len:120 gc:universal Amastigsp_a679078_7:951-1310(+)